LTLFVPPIMALGGLPPKNHGRKGRAQEREEGKEVPAKRKENTQELAGFQEMAWLKDQTVCLRWRGVGERTREGKRTP